MSAHAHPNYFKIYIWLLVLFVVSVLGPEVADLMALEGITRMLLVLTTAFGIAIVKAYLVCSYFMHLKFEKLYAPYVLLTCLILLFVFFFGVATDAMKAEGHNWTKAYQEPEIRDPHAAHGDAHGEGDHHGENEESSEDHH